MKKLLTIPAYLWAIACLLLIPVTFIGNQSFAVKMAKLPFMKVNPIYSGGEIADSVVDAELKTTIYEPVFESLIGESKKGFVQVKFSSPTDTLPLIIKREIDYNFDKTIDFSLEINTSTGETGMTAFNKLVMDVAVSSKVNEAWVVRVELLNLSKNK